MKTPSVVALPFIYGVQYIITSNPKKRENRYILSEEVFMRLFRFWLFIRDREWSCWLDHCPVSVSVIPILLRMKRACLYGTCICHLLHTPEHQAILLAWSLLSLLREDFIFLSPFISVSETDTQTHRQTHSDNAKTVTQSDDMGC